MANMVIAFTVLAKGQRDRMARSCRRELAGARGRTDGRGARPIAVVIVAASVRLPQAASGGPFPARIWWVCRRGGLEAELPLGC